MIGQQYSVKMHMILVQECWFTAEYGNMSVTAFAAEQIQ